MLMCLQNLVDFCPFILKIWSKNQTLTSIIGQKSVANLRKMTLNRSTIDHVNAILYTRFGLNISIRLQDMEQKPNSDINQGP